MRINKVTLTEIIMSLTTNKNFLQPTGFKFVIDRRNYPNLEFFAQTVTHPGSSVAPVELPTTRVTSIPLAGDKITYTTLDLEVILDEDMQSYKEMQSWLERIVNEGHVDETRSGAVSTYGDISLLILSPMNNKNITIKYKDCVPTDIGSFNLAANTGDVSFNTFTVSFRFSEFEIV